MAAIIVLAVTGVAWLFWRGASGYGCAWLVLLFVPAIGLRKMTELASHGDYRSARKLGMALQIFHPSADLRDQVRLFRHLESQPRDRVFSSVPVERKSMGRAANTQFRNAPAVFIFILLNVAAFVGEIAVGDWNDEVLHRIGAPTCVSSRRTARILARCDRVVLARRFPPSRFQLFCAVRSWTWTGTHPRHNPLRALLFDLRAGVRRRRDCSNFDGFCATG